MDMLLIGRYRQGPSYGWQFVILDCETNVGLIHVLPIKLRLDNAALGDEIERW